MIRNGWFVNTYGEVFAIIEGSMYQVEPEPFMRELEPGYYDEDFNLVAIRSPQPTEEDYGKAKAKESS